MTDGAYEPGGPRVRQAAREWPSREKDGGGGAWGLMAGAALIAFLLLFVPVFIWFFCRIEPRPGEIAILIRKTGEDLHSGQILALTPKQKGIQLDVLSEGRFFRNPYTWDWKMARITDIPAGKLGVKTRLYGDDLPPGRILAGPTTKGILAETLSPGKYRINPYAESVEQFDAIHIKPGCVGVQVSLIGDDVQNKPDIPAEMRNSFLVGEGMKGVMTNVLNPGTYYLNPYMYSVVEVNLQGQRFAMSGPDAIAFLTSDGFTVTVEGTIEYAIDREKAAILTHRVGEMNDILQKVILPRMRGFCRVEGSKHPAVDFIVGETRQKFQNDLDLHLRERCASWGVSIRSVLVRNIIPPDEIASIIRDREVAVQERKKFDQELEQAKSRAELVKQEMLAIQNKEKVDADTVRIRAEINAQQDQAVRLVNADKELSVAKVENDAAINQAQAIVVWAQAEADVIKMQNVAEATVLQNQVKAFGTGMGLARYSFYKKIGPRIESVLSSDTEEGLGSIFRTYVPQGKEVR